MIKDFFSVTKFILSFAVSLSALFAYIMAKGEIGLDMFLATFSVLLVAMGVSTLNQVQEFREDSKMERTKNRPIAAGRMSPRTGTIIAIVLILISFAFIYSLLGLTGINFFGNNLSKLFLNCLLLNALKSRWILLSNISSVNAGLKSTNKLI